ncbi:MAG: replicative DNA helicase [Phycisphaerae bacterium]|nr:replicative DNA helicase [Phycisphaerae bacterium]
MASLAPTTRSDLQRIPPHSIDAEMGLLGSMLLDREAIGAIFGLIKPNEAERFYREDHRLLFQVLVDLYDANKPIDLIVVRDELERRGLLAEVGGVEYIVQLAESVPSHVNAEHYAQIVREKSLLRDVIACSRRIMDDAYESTEDAKTVLDRAEQQLFNVTEQRVSQQVVRIREYLEETFRVIESREGHYLTGVPTGFVELDDILSGLQRGEMIIVAARPSMGKTAFGLTIAEHMAADEGKAVAFFSLEMSKEQVAQRLLCARGRVDSHKLRRGMLSEAEIQHLQQICADMRDMPMFLDDTPGMTVLEVRAKARRLKLHHDIAAVCVDYLQLMHTPGAESRQQEIAVISRGLKALARELNIPVVAMAQLNRSPEGREGHRPRMSDLRESGAIEQDADVVLLLHREEYYKPQSDDPEIKGLAEVIIAKQRNGPTGTVKLHFNQSLTRFDNRSIAPEPIDIGAASDNYGVPF